MTAFLLYWQAKQLRSEYSLTATKDFQRKANFFQMYSKSTGYFAPSFGAGF